jgi:four helix bundle protein
MNEAEMKRRTKALALRVVRVVESLPRSRSAEVIGRQLLRAGTSVGANYRAVCRAKSRTDFLHKLSIVEEEADECAYWLELLADAEMVPRQRLSGLLSECDQITAILVASIRSARRSPEQKHCDRRDIIPKSKIQNPK